MRRFSKYLLLSISLFSLIACHSQKSIKLSRLTTPKVEKISTKNNSKISETTYESYTAFTKKFTSLVMETNNKEKEESLGISIPDAYLCLAITGVISSDEARADILSYLELKNMDELRTSVKEIVSALCTLYKDYNGKYHGGYNLNSIWLNPDKVKLVKEKDEQLYKDLEEVFDASTYMEALTSDKANQYLKDNGLKDMPTPKIELNDDDPSAMSAMSVYYCLDYFDEEAKLFYKSQYESGTHKMDYTYGDKTEKVNYIHQQYNGVVYEGDDFHGANLPIQQLQMTFFLPDNKSAMPSTILEDVLEENYHLKDSEFIDYDEVKRPTNTFDLSVSAPYFSLNNKIDLLHSDLEKVLPVITLRGAGTRLAESIYGYETYLDFIKQFSVMKFNYDGFYSCSVTIAGYDAKSALEPEYEKFELNLDHPYIFEVNKNVQIGTAYTRLPIIIGEIVNPDYKD